MKKLLFLAVLVSCTTSKPDSFSSRKKVTAPADEVAIDSVNIFGKYWLKTYGDFRIVDSGASAERYLDSILARRKYLDSLNQK